MNAYVSVITKTIEAQRDKSFETRSRIYAKARQTIEEKLHREIASKYVAVRQLTLLDEAITAVEDEYKDRYKESSNDLFPPTYTSVEDAIKYMVPPPLAGGPKFEIVDNLLSWKPIHATNSENTKQESIHRYLSSSVVDLNNALESSGNHYPDLCKAVSLYSRVVLTDFNSLDVMAMWVNGSALLAYERAYREQNINRSLSNPLEPAPSAKLEQVCNLHSALAMSIPEIGELILESDQYRLDSDDLIKLGQSGDVLLNEFSNNKNLFDKDARIYTTLLKSEMHELGGRSAKQSYSAYVTLRNAIHSLIKFSIGKDPTLLNFTAPVSGLSALSGDLNFEFARNAVFTLHNHGAHILTFFNHSPELRAYVKWALDITHDVFAQNEL